MEAIFLSSFEHKYLIKHQTLLENRFDVRIVLPCEVKFSKEIICAYISGSRKGIGLVKNFLKNSLEEKKKQRRNSMNCIQCDRLPSMSGSSTSTISDDQLRDAEEDLNDSVIIIEPTSKRVPLVDIGSSSSDEENEVLQTATFASKRRFNKNQENPNLKRRCPMPSSIGTGSSDSQDSQSVPLPNFISLVSSQPSRNALIPLLQVKVNSDSRTREVITAQSTIPNGKLPYKKNGPAATTFGDDDIVILSDEDDDAGVVQPQNPQSCVSVIPRPRARRRLRPIVIDGSNVARLHGIATQSYSSKGIKIAVDYFLKRGHPQVTAFVPIHRRHTFRGPVVTTDENLLEELMITQNVVFTPSRRIDGARISCYDDRFIIELASSNGGVVVSNDTYKDLVHVSDNFKQTIEKRLLMYCFVGDFLMIPDDPLGRYGPKLEDFLSFPEES